MKESNLRTIAGNFKKETVVPFWMWNDTLEKDKLINQLREIKQKGMNQVIVHARFGLETPYLSEGWFSAFSWVLTEAQKLKMGIWIYDEFNWPSGYADGRVLSKNPEFQASHLIKIDKRYEKRKSTWKPAYSDTQYIDVLNPNAVAAFINEVHEQYWQRFKPHFGRTILGFFTDEPGIYNNFADIDPNSLPWTDSLPEFYHKLYGNNLDRDLDLIWQGETPLSIQKRINFWKMISTRYQESYFRPMQRWCHKHKVALIGHVLVEENMVDTAKTQGDFFSSMKYLDFAGYDLLGRLEQSTILPARLAYSASKHFSLNGICAETFGIFGWNLTPEEMRRVAKWQLDKGLDVIIPHALYYSLRGDRIDDCPPSFFVEKFWKGFGDFVAYVREVKANREASHTQHKPSLAIYYPIESVWGYLTPGKSKNAEFVDFVFKTTSFTVDNLGIDFDYLGSEFTYRDKLKEYQYLILPQATVLPLTTLKEIAYFIESGGRVVALGELPKIATAITDQDEFIKIMIELNNAFDQIPISRTSFYQAKIPNNTWEFTKNWITHHVAPIWVARAVRIARILGYKKPIETNKLTGLEEKLRTYLV